MQRLNAPQTSPGRPPSWQRANSRTSSPVAVLPVGHLQRVTYLAAPWGNLTGSFDADHVRQLAETSQIRNRSLGVGGLLMYYAPYFFEVIEGFPDAVWPLFQLVLQDPRYGRVILLEDLRCSERMYSDWTMTQLAREELPAMVPTILLQVAGAFLTMWQHLPYSAGQLMLQGKDPRSQPPVLQEVVVVFIRLVGVKAIQEASLLPFIVDIMDAFVDACVSNVVETGGEVAKFLNGMCMAYWPAAHAASAFEGISSIFGHLAHKRLLHPGSSPISLVHVRAGVHCGQALLCNAGTAKADFTLLGDCINVAARLVSQASILGVNLIVSAEAAVTMGAAALEALVDIGPQQLKGRAGTVHCYRDVHPSPDTGTVELGIRNLANLSSAQEGGLQQVRDYDDIPVEHRPPIFQPKITDHRPYPVHPKAGGCLAFLRRVLPCSSHPSAARPSLATLTYISTAAASVSNVELLRIKQYSQRINEAADITSELLFLNGTFTQKVEGPTAAVFALWERVLRDPRHQQVVVVHWAPLQERTCTTPLKLTILSTEELQVLPILPNLLRQIARTFQCLETYLPYPVTRCILAGTDPGQMPPVRVNLVMLAADIVSFTRLSEGCELMEVWQLCTTFTDLCTREIKREGGYVIRLIGDCVQAYFPSNAASAALSAAQSIVRQCKQSQRQLHRLDCRSAMSCGVGLDYGPVVMAPSGSKEFATFMLFGEVVRRVLDVESVSRTAGRSIILTRPLVDLLPLGPLLTSVPSPLLPDTVQCYAVAGEEWGLDKAEVEAAIKDYQSACRAARSAPEALLRSPSPKQTADLMVQSFCP